MRPLVVLASRCLEVLSLLGNGTLLSLVGLQALLPLMRWRGSLVWVWLRWRFLSLVCIQIWISSCRESFDIVRKRAVQGWKTWILEDPLVHPSRWLRPDLVPPSPFLRCDPGETTGGSGVIADPALIDAKFREAWMSFFCRSAKGAADLDDFSAEVEGGWLPVLDVFHLPPLTGDMLVEVVRRKKATAGSLDGWGWRELKALPAPWFDGLARTGRGGGCLARGFAGCIHCHDSQI